METNEKQFSCKACPQVFQDETELLVHWDAHHKSYQNYNVPNEFQGDLAALEKEIFRLDDLIRPIQDRQTKLRAARTALIQQSREAFLNRTDSFCGHGKLWHLCLECSSREKLDAAAEKAQHEMAAEKAWNDRRRPPRSQNFRRRPIMVKLS